MIQSRFDLTPFLSGLGIEIGIFRGVFSEHLLQHSHLSILYSVDPWLCFPTPETAESFYQETKERLAKFGKRSQILRTTALEAASYFQDAYFDFVYIDSSHTYEDTQAELAAYWPKMKPNGLFCGHDYANCPDVKKAVDEFALLHGLQVETTVRDEDTDWTGYLVNSWMIRVPS